MDRALGLRLGQLQKKTHPGGQHGRVAVMLRLVRRTQRMKTSGNLPLLLQQQSEQRRVCSTSSSKTFLRQAPRRRASSYPYHPSLQERRARRRALRQGLLVRRRHLKQLRNLVVPGRPSGRELGMDGDADRRRPSHLGDQHGLLSDLSCAHRLGCCQRRPPRPRGQTRHRPPLTRGLRLRHQLPSRRQERPHPRRPLGGRLQPPRRKASWQQSRHLQRRLPSQPLRSKWRRPLGRRPRLPRFGPRRLQPPLLQRRLSSLLPRPPWRRPRE